MKKILVTSTDLMMVQFLLPHVKNLSENGFKIDLACSNVGGRLDEVREKVAGCVNNVYVVRLRRNPLSPINLKGYWDMKQVMRQGDYDIIWTNEPVMGVVTRFCAKKIRRTGTKVLYMAHGFHFYNGAPLQNWLIYYPIERMMARYTDMIVTVNSEDYCRARTFRTKDVKYIHGIGINTERLTRNGNIDGIRRELNLPNDAFVVLSVGELNKNKNHSTIIRAISRMNDSQVHYLVCGKGDTYDKLCRLSKKLGVERNIHFLGYRRDVVDICSQADVYVMPSFREGLPVSSLEAMYCGLPLLTSNIRGLVDVNNHGENGYLYNPIDVDGFGAGIEKMKANPQLRSEMGQRNKQVVIPFTLENTKKEVLSIINELIS